MKRAYAVVGGNGSARWFLNDLEVNHALAAAGFAPGDQVEIRPRVAPGEVTEKRLAAQPCEGQNADWCKEGKPGDDAEACAKARGFSSGHCACVCHPPAKHPHTVALEKLLLAADELVTAGMVYTSLPPPDHPGLKQLIEKGNKLSSEACAARSALGPEFTRKQLEALEWSLAAAPEGQEVARDELAAWRSWWARMADKVPAACAAMDPSPAEDQSVNPWAKPPITDMMAALKEALANKEAEKAAGQEVPSALPREVVCEMDGAAHVGTHRQGFQCINPRPALPEEVVCDMVGPAHVGVHRKGFQCINTRPAHPPSSQNQLGEKGVEARPSLQPCAHGRADYRACPHCMGFSQGATGRPPPSATFTITEAKSEPVSAAPVDPLLAIDAVTDKEPRPCGRCDEPVLVPVGYRSIPLCGRPECEADEAALHRRTAMDVCPACNGSGGTETICAACKGDGYCAAEPSSAPRVEPEKPYPSITLAEWEVTLWPDNQVGLRWTLGDFSRLMSRAAAMQLADALHKLAAPAHSAAEPEKLGEDMNVTLRDVAAYLLDRADQYETTSGCWIALSDAASDLVLGEVRAALRHGELDSADLYARVDGFAPKANAGPSTIATKGEREC